METDDARADFRKVRARFTGELPKLDRVPGLMPRFEGRELEVCVNGDREETIIKLRALGGEVIAEENLSLEEIFLVILNQKATKP
jgi:hypothetical protein